ncbi:hypothetical protein HXX76_000697 [Chlamydomonas incerta]|uniref:Protein kinase domain-containing protein n=1 Tax=Chlamydomonas incerta TaxID=51695 RepID=A0A835WER7_CHLIN|nr:hypothetical protein HXX76_000697 [Chlamydomonas incerta]|eukprot:KAG2446097.1 hypothetical protein HXX76_000697 [Chlamydomonas incerta]
MPLSARGLDLLVVAVAVLKVVCALPTLGTAFFLLAAFVLACQAWLQFQTALSEGKSTLDAVAAAATELWKDLHNKPPVAEDDQIAVATDERDIPTGTIAGLHAAPSPGHDRLSSQPPASPDNAIFGLESASELYRLPASPFTSPFLNPASQSSEALQLVPSVPSTVAPASEGAPQTTRDIDLNSSVLHIENCLELLVDAEVVVQEAVSSSGQAGTCVLVVVVPKDGTKDANRRSSGSGVSGFPSSGPSSPSSPSTLSSPSYPELPSSLSFTLDCHTEEPEPAAPQHQHPMLQLLPSSLSLSWSARDTPSPQLPGPQCAHDVPPTTAATMVNTIAVMGYGSQEATGLPTDPVSASRSGAAISASLSLGAAAAASNCQGTALERNGDQQPQHQQSLHVIQDLHKMPVDADIYRELRTSGAQLFVVQPDDALLGKGGCGIVEAGTVTTSHGVAHVVSKTAAEPGDDLQNRLLLTEGAVMFGLQDAGLVGDGCTVRALALSGDPDAGGAVTLVMERARCTLSEELKQGELQPHFRAGTMPVLPWRSTLAVLRAVASALAATHRLGYVHQDVKPDNVLLRYDGTVALGDFGCAAQFPQGGRTYDPEECGGSRHFASPEVVQRLPGLGPKAWEILKQCKERSHTLPLTRAVDIWSLGVLAICLLVTGAKGTEAARYARRDLALPAYLPNTLAQLVLDCTEEMHFDRPSAERVLQRLGAIEAEVLAAEAAAAAEAVAEAAAAAAELAMNELAVDMAASMAVDLCC